MHEGRRAIIWSEKTIFNKIEKEVNAIKIKRINLCAKKLCKNIYDILATMNEIKYSLSLLMN